jgi:hypothetical protein
MNSEGGPAKVKPRGQEYVSFGVALRRL